MPFLCTTPLWLYILFEYNLEFFHASPGSRPPSLTSSSASLPSLPFPSLSSQQGHTCCPSPWSSTPGIPVGHSVRVLLKHDLLQEAFPDIRLCSTFLSCATPPTPSSCLLPPSPPIPLILLITCGYKPCFLKSTVFCSSLQTEL